MSSLNSPPSAESPKASKVYNISLYNQKKKARKMRQTQHAITYLVKPRHDDSPDSFANEDDDDDHSHAADQPDSEHALQ